MKPHAEPEEKHEGKSENQSTGVREFRQSDGKAGKGKGGRNHYDVVYAADCGEKRARGGDSGFFYRRWRKIIRECLCENRTEDPKELYGGRVAARV